MPSSRSSISLNYLDFLQARPLMTKVIEGGNHDALVDPRLGNEYNNNEMEKMIACAAACVRHSARRRPRMSQVHNSIIFMYVFSSMQVHGPYV
jgi:hypothetical protein